jgi:hypothetical protein
VRVLFACGWAAIVCSAIPAATCINRIARSTAPDLQARPAVVPCGRYRTGNTEVTALPLAS